MTLPFTPHTPAQPDPLGAQPHITRYRGAYGAARSWVVAHIARDRSPLLVICKNRSAAEHMLADLEFFLPDRTVRWFPSWETLPFESVSPAPDISGLRLRVMHEISTQQNIIVVASSDALMHTVPPPDLLDALTLRLAAGQTVTRAEVQAALSHAGYAPVSLVESAGEMAAHGLVIDVFPAGLRNPLRIEFGDLIGRRTLQRERRRHRQQCFSDVQCALLR